MAEPKSLWSCVAGQTFSTEKSHNKVLGKTVQYQFPFKFLKQKFLQITQNKGTASHCGYTTQMKGISGGYSFRRILEK